MTKFAFLLMSIFAYSTITSAQEGGGEAKLLFHVEGFYSVKGELGLFGVVLDRRENMATFKPCHAPIIEIELDRLESTSFTCDDSTHPDTNPMMANCTSDDFFWSDSSALKQLQAQTGEHTLGTAYALEPETQTITVVPTVAQQIQVHFNAVATFASCGEFLIGLDEDGDAVLNVYAQPPVGGNGGSPRR